MPVQVSIKFDRDYVALVKEFERNYPNVIDDAVKSVASDGKMKVMNNQREAMTGRRGDKINGVRTGQLLRNWIIRKIGLSNYSLQNSTSYANYVETGTYQERVTSDNENEVVKSRGNKGIQAKLMVRRSLKFFREEVPNRVRLSIETMWRTLGH